MVDFVSYHLQCALNELFNDLYEQEERLQKAKPVLVFIWAPEYRFKTDLKNSEPILEVLPICQLMIVIQQRQNMRLSSR